MDVDVFKQDERSGCKMEWITNEMLFYGGILLAGISALLAIIFFCISKVKSAKLNAQLDKEYGERSK